MELNLLGISSGSWMLLFIGFYWESFSAEVFWFNYFKYS
jgi:hypothetical protein